MQFIKYLATAKVAYDNRQLIIGLSTLACQLAYVGGNKFIELYINRKCTCRMCEKNRENGFDPVH